jgi:lipoate-protein ligase B
MKILDLGRKNYLETYEIQKQLLQERILDKIEDTLILVEHDPVYTVGRSGFSSDSNNGMPLKTIFVPSLKKEVDLVQIERGGKITFHGPGQIVGYPIFKMQAHDIRRFLSMIEQKVIDAIHIVAKNFSILGLKANRYPESLELEPGQLQTGVWIRNKKIASIGIAVKHWVSFHGFALNVVTDLRYFQAIDPCGFSGEIMTNLKQEILTLKGGANTDSLSDSFLLETTKKALILSFMSQKENFIESLDTQKDLH